MPEHMVHKHNFLFLGIAIVLIALLAVVFMFVAIRYSADIRVADSILESNRATPPPTNPQEAQSLGAELYEKSSNPIEDKVPGIAPTANPIQGAYQNPFE